MQSIQQRVAVMEVLGQEQSRRIDDVRDAVKSLEASIDHRLEALDGRIDRQFRWLVGIQVTTLLAVVAALAAR